MTTFALWAFALMGAKMLRPPDRAASVSAPLAKNLRRFIVIAIPLLLTPLPAIGGRDFV
jgi:hypothetical protein